MRTLTWGVSAPFNPFPTLAEWLRKLILWIGAFREARPPCPTTPARRFSADQDQFGRWVFDDCGC